MEGNSPVDRLDPSFASFASMQEYGEPVNSAEDDYSNLKGFKRFGIAKSMRKMLIELF